ncbi:Sodium- and chloride-dependent neutral and basic amino acid transporter B(0+), partial [Ophiophagus hannah]
MWLFCPGGNRFIKDIEMMIGKKSFLFWLWWRACWFFITPCLLLESPETPHGDVSRLGASLEENQGLQDGRNRGREGTISAYCYQSFWVVPSPKRIQHFVALLQGRIHSYLGPWLEHKHTPPN